jgi:hypothetical protein
MKFHQLFFICIDRYIVMMGITVSFTHKMVRTDVTKTTKMHQDTYVNNFPSPFSIMQSIDQMSSTDDRLVG